MRKFNIRLERVLLGLVLALAMALGIAQLTEQDRVSQLTARVDSLESYMGAVGSALIAVAAHSDTAMANTKWLYNAMQGHAEWHGEQVPRVVPRGDR